jgi:putative spermidine/putrescine transport system substrate-binding protein
MNPIQNLTEVQGVIGYLKAFPKTLLIPLIGIAVLSLAAAKPAWAHDELTVVSWGGSYTRSQMLAYVRPYRKETGNRVEVLDYNGGLWEIRDQVEAYNVKWDVVDLLLADVIRGCQEGLLEKIDPAILAPAPDGTPATEDFIEGSLQECGVGTVIWSTVVAYDADQFSGQDQRPRMIKDFFDVEKFPGTRGLQNTPRVNQEWALMADGVPTDKVYEVLATQEGLDRAFKMLDKIKPHAVWWDTGAEPPRLLADGAVVMTSAYNGRIYDAVTEKGENLVIVWDGQVWDIDLWGIPKGTDNLEQALKFVAYSTEPQRLSDQARYSAYGPARKSAMALVDEAVKLYLPTTADNLKHAL